MTRVSLNDGEPALQIGRSEARRLLASHGLRPSRALGQNFVVDPNTVRRVARLSEVGPGDCVIEVGGGLGSLTLALAETGAAVTVLEIDSGLIPILSSVAEPLGVRVVHGDALSIDWSELLGSPSPDEPAQMSSTEWTLVSNLPYNIATPLIANLLDDVAEIRRLVVMVQKEVGERLVAEPGDPAYGAVSVKIAYYATASIVAKVPASVFMPRPNVDSVVVRIDRRETPAVITSEVAPSRLFEVVRAGFGQRRKMLRRSLANIVEPAAFEAAGVDPASRAEELDVLTWGRLARWPEAPDPQ
jgi:16S rRNA (adenine1518-N6/adenine1519-N6)-dimethyltransferase